MSSFQCITCGFGPEEDPDEIKAHVEEKHTFWRFSADAVEEVLEEESDEIEQQTLVTDGGQDDREGAEYSDRGVTWNHPAPHPDGCTCSWCEEVSEA